MTVRESLNTHAHIVTARFRPCGKYYKNFLIQNKNDSYFSDETNINLVQNTILRHKILGCFRYTKCSHSPNFIAIKVTQPKKKATGFQYTIALQQRIFF